MDEQRFERQLAFLKEIDRLKSIFRRTRLLDNSRFENDAEHAWHLALMVMTLAEYADAGRLDIFRVIKMVLIHDIVEIDSGDTFLYDSRPREEVKESESRAASRIFGLLPEDQRSDFIELWREFEARETPEAKFAAALDRFEPILQNAATQGYAWQKHGISRCQAETANQPIIEDGSAAIWQYARKLFADCEKKRYFPEERGPKQHLEPGSN